MASPAFDPWLELEHWIPAENDNPGDEFFSMQVTLPGGRKYALNVWAFHY